MELGAGKKNGKKDKNDVLDDLLGDLLSDDSPSRMKNAPSTPTRQRASSGKGGKSSTKDEAFYSSLAAMADSDDGSDMSEVDVDQVAHSLGGLDDMDADLFGDTLSKKSNSGRSGKPTTPRRNHPKTKGAKSPRLGSPTRSDTPNSPPGSARSSLKKKPVKPPSPSTIPTTTTYVSPPQVQPEHKPGTAPGKMSDLSSASENLKPNQPTSQRPDTAPKVKKKYDFGDFDPDDPLAGVLDDDDLDELSESDRPKSATRKLPGKTAAPSQEDVAKSSTLDSPRRRNNLMDRPPTRSGSGDNLGGSTVEQVIKSATKSPQGNIFSDSDDLLDGLGLESKGPEKKAEVTHKPKAGGDELRPARSVFDSLLGKGSSASDLLEPKEKKQFVLDSKYSQSNAGTGSGDVKDTDEDDFNFGSYQPSAATGSRPSSRRSVRFQDDDDIFGLDSRPSPRSKSPRIKSKPPPDMEWLEAEASKPPPPAPATNSPLPTPTSGQAGSVTAKPPTPSGTKPESASRAQETPKKSPASVTNSAPSPRAWLGLDESDSDEDELFKPKRSSARNANLPQSPAVSVNPSPRMPPKRGGKKETTPASPNVGTPTGSVVAGEDDDDDWLARARSRRQQMLSKEDGKGPDDDQKSVSAQGDTDMTTGRGGEIDPQSMRVDLSSLMVDSPKFGGVSTTQSDLFTTPQGRPSWDSPRTPLSATVGGNPQQSQMATGQFPGSDPRLKFSSSAGGQGQMSTPVSAQSMEQQMFLQQQQQQQQYMQQMQQQKKAELIQQQQQLEQMLQNIQTQYNSVSMTSMPAVSMPSYSQITGTVELPDSLQEAHTKIRTLALEKHYSESLLESTKRRYEEELMAVESSYKNRLQIVEESNRKKEARLREENESLMQQHLSKVRQLEQEKGELSSSNYRKLEDLERDRAKDLENLREQHRLNVLSLKREHEEALERLAAAKNQEINLVANANDTSKSLTAVVEQIQNNARDLGDLQLKVDSWNRQGLDQREISLRSKDEQLRMLQERLQRQEEDNDRERKRLEELIARMETQLREQTRSLEEEKWKLKQDQSRAEAQQRALEEERRLWLEQQARERVTLERSRENYLEEQRSSMAQISEERRTMVEERTKFQAEQKTFREKMHQDSMKYSQAEADYEVLKRTIAEEKAHQSSRMQELRKEEERINAERNRLERERDNLEHERDQLADQANQIRQQSSQMNYMTEAASRTHQEGQEAKEEAMRISSQIEKRESEVQRQQNAIKLMEEHIAQEKLRLAKEKKEVENLKSSSLCVNCRSPLQGGVAYPSPLKQNGYHIHQYAGSVGVSPVQSIHLSSSLHQAGTNPLDHIANSIANDRAVRMWKIQAIKDKEYLDEETLYLENLKYTPYHSTASKS